MAAHDDVLRQAVAAHGGFLFKHTGDGVCAAFAFPRSAVLAAVAAQQALELPVRMGLATGEAEPRQGDYFGTVLNRAARVMAAGHGGQILVADSTMQLLSGVDVISLGPHRLRDVPEPIGLFQVCGTGLRVEFPPLRTLDRRIGNIRAPVSSFVGREADLVTIAEEVRRRRLVTLTGVGGVGKTRLALEVARQLSAEFADGARLLELASVVDPAAVPNAAAALVGITQQPGATLAQSVAGALEGKALLLVVDNCEHLRDAAADLIESILADTTTVRILATSREGLGISDEHLWAVPSLDIRTGINSAAVDLFVDRARTVDAAFEFTNAEEAAAAVEICRRLDGIPLAIELAASRMASMTVSEVRDRLDQRFRLLVGSRRGVERHQTLRHTVAWSFALLNRAERDLLARCSVFAGGFDLAAVRSVAAPDADEFEVLDILDALVRKSLLVVHRVSGRTRYSMLETIRQFAEEQLVDDGSAADVRDQLAAYFAAKESDLEAVWDGPDQSSAYDWFTTELPNLRSAFRWAADSSDFDVAVRIATYSAFFGCAVANLEPLAWAEELVPEACASRHSRRVALLALASQCWMRGRTKDSLRYCEQAINLVRTEQDSSMPFGIDGLLGAAYMSIGEARRAVEWYTERLAAVGSDKVLNRVGLILGLMACGRRDEARIEAEGAMTAAEATRNPYKMSFMAMACGYSLFEVDPAAALETSHRGWSLAVDTGNRGNESHLASNLCRVMVHHGEPLEALNRLEEVIHRYYDVGNVNNLRHILAIFAVMLNRFGRFGAAATVAGFAVTPFTNATFPEMGALADHLREMLGKESFGELTAVGASMTATSILEQADQEIAELRREIAVR